MKPTPGTTARAEYDADHGTYDSKPVAGSDEEPVAYRCPELVCDDADCFVCDHSRTPHSYCPHVEHFCLRLDKFISCVEVTA